MEHARAMRMEFEGKTVALYHVVYAHEGFEESARALFKLVQKAQLRQPGKRRVLYLDIEGHRSDEGGFDGEMLELQRDFLIQCLGPYLSEIHAPLLKATKTGPQENDIPPALVIQGLRDNKPE